VKTTQITAHGGNGIGQTAGDYVKERLFLDGIDIFRNKPAIDQTVKSAINIVPYPASAIFPLVQAAMMAAQIADHAAVLLFSIEKSLMHLDDNVLGIVGNDTK